MLQSQDLSQLLMVGNGPSSKQLTLQEPTSQLMIASSHAPPAQSTSQLLRSPQIVSLLRHASEPLQVMLHGKSSSQTICPPQLFAPVHVT